MWKAAFYAVIATLVVAPVALGDRGYEIFLIHLVTMELVMVEVLHFPIYTGSMAALFVGTLGVTIPLAWLLHRFTRVRPAR
jgi:peptidoglycan/LPS O-acetylase OafA/YrhL